MIELFDSYENGKLICIDRKHNFSVVYFKSDIIDSGGHFIITLDEYNLYLYKLCLYLKFKSAYIFRLEKIIHLDEILTIIKSPVNLRLNDKNIDFLGFSVSDFIIQYDLVEIKNKMKKIENLKVFL